LIVDDEPNVRLVFRTALESAGYAVAEAADGPAALELIRKRPFDAVLLDLRMPGLDGLTALRTLREEGVGVPVVVVTAHGNTSDVVAAMRLGAADFVPKPVSPETLRRAVREAIVSRNVRAGQAPAPTLHLGRESLARAEQAARRGDFDEAEFFLRVAVPLGADPTETRRLSDQVARLRRAPNAYRVLGDLTCG
jgi:DNA-binding response OmpR family regulator